ncbi:FAD-containing monooxygenase EthA, partial [Acinetobacter baumannii]
WDLFRYPGIRSDSDLHTFGYEFKPWVDDKSIADAGAILRYLRQAAAENGIQAKIRFRHKVVSASWSSQEARWQLVVERGENREPIAMRARWIFWA